MQIQIRHDEHVRGDKTGWLEQRVQATLERYREQLTTIEVHLADENGPKNSDGDVRATVQARLRGFAPVAATSHGDHVGAALDAALAKITRMLDDKLGRVRDHHANL